MPAKGEKMSEAHKEAMRKGKQLAMKRKRALGLPLTNKKEKNGALSQAVAIYVTKAYRCLKSKSIDEMDASHLNIVLAYRELHRGSDV